MNKNIDVLVVGGGPAGLTAALTLGRANRSVIVSDNNQPRNEKASHMQNFPSRDGTPPSEFRKLIRDDLVKYEKVIIKDIGVESIKRVDKLFEVIFADQQTFLVKKIILAHGVKDTLPTIPGANEIFGHSLFFCPYCHGYEHKDSPIAVVGSIEYAMHMAVVVSGLTSDLKVFTNGETQITPEQKEMFSRRNIEIITDRISSFTQSDGNLQNIKLENNQIIDRSFVFVQANFKLRSDLGIKLGCKLTELGLYQLDEMGRTSESGVYAAGDVSSMKHSVLMACASAQSAAAMANYEILSEL